MIDDSKAQKRLKRRRGIIATGGLVIFAGLLIWVVLAFIVRVSISTQDSPRGSQTLTQVEAGVRASSEREGEVSRLRCRPVTSDAWSCRVRFRDGEVVFLRAVSYKSQEALGISVVRRNNVP